VSVAAPAHQNGHVHEAVLYETDDEFLHVVVPFLEEGRDGNEPSLVVVHSQASDLLRAALGNTTGITFLDTADPRSNPARAIRFIRDVLAARAASGATRIRVVSEVPHPGLGRPWDPWARYEAAINHAYAEFPLWNICAYDLRITSPAVLDDVARTHPHLTDSDGVHQVNPRYEDPAGFLARRSPAEVDPLEATTSPVVDMSDPTPGAARRAAHAAGHRALVDSTQVDDLIMAVNEAVTNALSHGRPPVRLRLWAVPGRVVVSISDRGSGPADPFAGLLPTTGSASGGLGLWLIHQICSHATFSSTDDGFTIRLVFEAADTGRDGHADVQA
jgi:anti-sigma regulatory factor (Ser/Thr protein kinase)